MKKFTEVIDCEYSDLSHGSIAHTFIEKSEMELSCRLPASYKEFLGECLGGSFKDVEIFTPQYVDLPKNILSSFDLTQNNLRYREYGAFKDHQVVFWNDNGEEYYYFDLNDPSGEDECWIYRLDRIDGSNVRYAKNMLEFFERRIAFYNGVGGDQLTYQPTSKPGV